MSDQPSPPGPPAKPEPPAQPAPPPDAGHLPMSEEMDSARRTLPPILPVLAAAAVIAVAVFVFSRQTSKPSTTGAVMRVVAAELPAPAPAPAKKGIIPPTPAPEKSVMAVVHLRLENKSDRPLFLRKIRASLEVPGGKTEEDQAASAVDHDRYLQAFPDLLPHKIAALSAETRIAPGGQQEGMVMFAFPVSRESFDQRKSFTVTLELYDRTPLVLSEKK